MIHRPPAEPSFEPGTYRHYKGGEYRAICVACDEATLEWMVVYRPLYEHEGMPDLWIRPYRDFFGTVRIDGDQIPRFRKINDPEQADTAS